MTRNKAFRKSPIIETAALQKFHSRLQYIYQHMQLSDASLSRISEFLESFNPNNTNISVCLGESETTHNKLNHPAKEHVRIVNYSRSKNSEYSILELYR